jgi:outer membrane receptor for ferrienterochelin and colicins
MSKTNTARALAALASAVTATAASAQPTPPPSPSAPQTIVVTATRHALPQADAPAATSVVTQRELEDRGADDVLEALRGETGVAAIGRPLGGRRVLSLRGMESRHTLMLVDGQRVAATDGVIGNSDFQLDWIALGDIDRIEVVRGPMSVLYGSEALGGVVNIVTRRPGDRLAGRARVEGLIASGDRGGDGHRAGARVDVPLAEAFSLAVGASDTRRQALVSAADARIDELEGQHRTDGSAQLLWRAARGHELLLEHRQGQEDRWGGARERGGQRRYHLSLHDIERRHSALTWDADWSNRTSSAGGLRTQLRAYASMLDHHNARTEGVAALRPNRVDETVVDGNAGTTVGAHRLTGGLEWRDEGLRNASLAGGEGSVTHRAAYLQDEWSLGALALTLGARHDRHEVFGGRTSPRLYGVWKPGAAWTVKGGIGWGFKAPTLKQNTAGYAEDEGPFTYAANPALEPEVNRAAEVGVAWQSPAFGVQAMVFHNRVRNLITPVLVSNAPPRPRYEWRNVDVAILKGVETGIDWRVMSALSLKVNHQWLDARDDQGSRLDRRPKNIVGAALEWNGGAAGLQAGAPWHARTRGGLRVDHQRGLLLASTTPGSPPQPVPAFTLVSAYGAHALSATLELGAGIDNLGNLSLAEKSTLYVNAFAPRTYRVSATARW